MALPLYPIEVWANADYTLPNAHTKNKIRPIDDLWTKGYDKGQRPDVQAWNYLWFNITDWIRYMSNEQIPALDGKFLQKALNLSDLEDKGISRTNLDVFSKGESDNRYVNVAGDVMTGELTVPSLRFPSASSDTAYITTSVPGDDTTYLDFVVGDNVGSDVISDKMRFLFLPTTNPAYEMVSFAMDTATVARVNINGRLIVQTSVTAGSLNTNGNTATASLSVSGNNATVAGRQIVRSVNGKAANSTGDVIIDLPPQGVQGTRLGAQYIKGYAASKAQLADPGGVLVGLQEYASDNEIHQYYFRPVQVTFDGVNWVTVAQV